MKWDWDSPCRSHTYPEQGRRSPSRWSGWELEFGDCGAIPEWGLLLTVERWIEGMRGRRLWWEMPVEESRSAIEARQYCWVLHRGRSYYHNLSLPTCQHQQLTNREVAPSNAWHTEQDPHPGCSFKWLMLQTTEEAHTQGVPLSVWHADLE